MKRSVLVFLCLLIAAVATAWLWFTSGGQAIRESVLGSAQKSAPIAAAKRPMAATDLRIIDPPAKSEFRLEATAFEAGKYYAGAWQPAFAGLFGAVTCATCHAEKIYRVKKGDNLTRISRAHGLKGYQGLYDRNRKVIGRNPDFIKPDQQFLIPAVSAGKSATPSRASVKTGKSSRASVSSANCAICHGQIARSAGKIDCRICHLSQHVAKAASAQAKRLVVTRRAARSPGEPFRWRVKGGDKFGPKRSHVLAVELAPLDNEAKRLIIDAIKTPGKPCKIVPGEQFDLLLFAHYRWEGPAIWDPKDGQEELEATCWEARTKDRENTVKLADFCQNLGIRSRPLPPEAPAPPPPPPPTEEAAPPVAVLAPPPPVTEAPPPPAEKQPLNLTLAPPTGPFIQPPPVAEAPPKVGQVCQYKLDWEGNAFGGVRWPVSGGDAQHNYAGANLVIFPMDCRQGSDRWRLGPSWEGVWFDGHVAERERLEYEGNRQVFGVELQYLTLDTKTWLDLRYGWKKVDVETNTGYRAQERVDLINIDATRTYYFPKDNTSRLKTLTIGGHFDGDLGGQKNSRVNNLDLSASQDPRLDGSELSGRVRVVGKEFGRTGISPVAQLQTDYVFGPQIAALEPRIGVELDDGWSELTTSYRANFQKGKKDDDTWGLSLNLSLDKLYRRAKLLGWKGFFGQTNGQMKKPALDNSANAR